MKYTFVDASEVAFMNKSKPNMKEYKVINKCAEAGYYCYLKDLQNWQLGFAPMHYDDEIIVSTQTKDDSYNEEAIIKECIISLGYSNSILKEKQEIREFFNKIKQNLYSKIKTQISGNEFLLLISTLSNLEYNTCITSAILGWINNETKEYEVVDNFSRNLIRTLNMSRQFSVGNTNELYVTVESKFALDKTAMQKLIQLILAESKISIPRKVDLNNIEQLHNIVIGLARAISLIEVKQTDIMEGCEW